MTAGCQSYPLTEWAEMTADRIATMDRRAGSFFAEHGELIRELAIKTGRVEPASNAITQAA